jgi:hypothetical protein
MFVKTKELQLIIKGQYINNSNFFKPTLNLHIYEIEFLMLVYAMIFPNTTFTKKVCRNPSLGLATKARAYKGVGQEGSRV